MTYYMCGVCDQPITGDDIDDRHSTTGGDDCHARCCESCIAEDPNNLALAFFKAHWNNH